MFLLSLSLRDLTILETVLAVYSQQFVPLKCCLIPL